MTVGEWSEGVPRLVKNASTSLVLRGCDSTGLGEQHIRNLALISPATTGLPMRSLPESAICGCLVQKSHFFMSLLVEVPARQGDKSQISDMLFSQTCAITSPKHETRRGILDQTAHTF